MRTLMIALAALPLLVACSGGGAAGGPAANQPANQPTNPPAEPVPTTPPGPKLWAWGEFVGGPTMAPYRWQGPEGTTRVVTPPVAKPEWALAIADGKLWAWGKNAPGKWLADLGRSPKQVGDFSGVTDVAVLPDQCGVVAGGKLWWWDAAAESAVQVQTVDDIVAVYVIDGAFAARAENGKCWPIREGQEHAHEREYLIAQVAHAGDLTAELSTAGEVWLYGNASRGQLGDGTAPNEPVARKCGFTQKVKQLALGDGFVVALVEDGTMWTWGDPKGALGHGTNWPTEKARRPAQIVGLTGIVQVQAAGGSAYALDNRGNLWSWGDNSKGQLGHNDKARKPAPARIQALSKVKWFQAGLNCAYCETE